MHDYKDILLVLETLIICVMYLHGVRERRLLIKAVIAKNMTEYTQATETSREQKPQHAPSAFRRNMREHERRLIAKHQLQDHDNDEQ